MIDEMKLINSDKFFFAKKEELKRFFFEEYVFFL